VVLGDFVPVDLVAGQDGDGTKELPAVVEHEQTRPLRLQHVLETLAEEFPAVLPAAGGMKETRVRSSASNAWAVC
jgi:hypothetical protein